MLNYLRKEKKLGISEYANFFSKDNSKKLTPAIYFDHVDKKIVEKAGHTQKPENRSVRISHSINIFF